VKFYKRCHLATGHYTQSHCLYNTARFSRQITVVDSRCVCSSVSWLGFYQLVSSAGSVTILPSLHAFMPGVTYQHGAANLCCCDGNERFSQEKHTAIAGPTCHSCTANTATCRQQAPVLASLFFDTGVAKLPTFRYAVLLRSLPVYLLAGVPKP
jgi:hypothetical protein